MRAKLLKTLASSFLLILMPGCIGPTPVTPQDSAEPPYWASAGPAPFGTISANTAYLEDVRIDPEMATRFKLVDMQNSGLRIPAGVLDPPSDRKAILPQHEEIEQEIWQKANNENERNIDTCVQKFVDLRGHTLRILGELRE